MQGHWISKTAAVQEDAHWLAPRVKDEKWRNEASKVNQQPDWWEVGLLVMLGSLAYSMRMVGSHRKKSEKEERDTF